MTASDNRRRLHCVLVLATALCTMGLYCADPYYEATEARPLVANPLHTPPLILADELDSLHHFRNVYEPLGNLLQDDGYRVRNLDVPYDPACDSDLSACAFGQSLLGAAILVIVPHQDGAAPIAADKAAAIASWIADHGGSLLVVLDHNMTSVVTPLLAPLGVEVVGHSSPSGSLIRLPGNPASPILEQHPISEGRTGFGEAVDQIDQNGGSVVGVVANPPPDFVYESVVTNGGGSFGLAGSHAVSGGRFFITGDRAAHTNRIFPNVTLQSIQSVDLTPCFDISAEESATSCSLIKSAEVHAPLFPPGTDLATAMIGSLLTPTTATRFGLIDADNAQYTLNVVHWLEGIAF